MVKSLKINNRRQNPYIKISAPPDSFTMDIMDVTSYPAQDKDRPLHSKRYKILSNVHSAGHEYVLVLIETTSRKIFAYPMRNKTAATTYEKFQQFLKDSHNRVSNVTSDLGNEYTKIWDDKELRKRGVRFFKVNASENYHTPLAMVDRAIRTLRTLLYLYFSESGKYNFHEAIPKIVEIYNNTTHSSLYVHVGKGRKREYFTPDQVWTSPILMKKINRKDWKRGEKGRKFYERRFKLGQQYHYRIGGDEFSKSKRSGMISNDVVTLIGRQGKCFYVKSENPKLNKKIIPYRNLFPVTKSEGELTKKVYKMSKTGLVEVPAKRIPRMSVRKHRDLMALTDRKPERLQKMLLPGRTRRQTRKIIRGNDDDDDDDEEKEEEEEEDEDEEEKERKVKRKRRIKREKRVKREKPTSKRKKQVKLVNPIIRQPKKKSTKRKSNTLKPRRKKKG